MKTYTATEVRKKFSEAYNRVRHGGEPVAISSHGDSSVVMIRLEDVYPEPPANELYTLAGQSGAFAEDELTGVDYE